MDESEVFILRKKLLHANEQYEDLQEELKLADEKYLKLLAEYEKDKEIIQKSRDDLMKIEGIVQQRVADRLANEMQMREHLENELKDRKELIEQLKLENARLTEKEKMLEKSEQHYKSKLDEAIGGNFEIQTALNEIKKAKVETTNKEEELERRIRQLNELSRQTQDLISENRVLREMAGVDQNFGLPLHEIKLAEAEKLEELKIKVRHYEDEIHELEKERAILKARLRERPCIGGKEDFTRGLTPEQVLMVEEFIMRLKMGKATLMDELNALKLENERLKADINSLQRGGMATSTELEKIVERVIMKRSTTQQQTAGGDNKELLEKIQLEHAEMLREFRDLLESQNNRFSVTEGGARPPGANQSTVKAALPRGGSKSFYGSRLKFPGDTLGMIEVQAEKVKQNDYAFLYLALMECVEMNARKDAELNVYTIDLPLFEAKLRQFLLQRNELYKDYAKQYAEWKEQMAQNKDQIGELSEKLNAEQIKNGDLEKICSLFEKGSMGEKELKEKIIELTKRSSILEISVMRLSRKYLTLQDQYKLLHKQFMNIELDNKEKEVQYESRLSKLKEWKAKAVLELKALYKRCRNSVPLQDYEQQRKELNMMREKDSLAMETSAELVGLKADNVRLEREKAELEQQLKEAKDMANDADSEFAIVRARLSSKDPQYAYERAVFERVIQSFKTNRMSPIEAFELFDKDGNGQISRDEFRQVMNKFGFDLSMKELDAVMHFMDVDSSGGIRYEKFIRALKRHGVSSRTAEENIVARISEALWRSNINLETAFSVIDQNGDNILSTEEMIDALKAMRLGVTEDEISRVVKYLYPEGVAGIDYRHFIRKFQHNKEQLIAEEKKEQAEFKQNLLQRIDEKLFKRGIQLQQAFILSDGYVTKQAFMDSCQNIELGATAKELSDLWAELDPKVQGKVLFTDIAMQILSAKTASRKSGKSIIAPPSEISYAETEAEDLKTKIAILQERESVAIEKAKREMDAAKEMSKTLEKRVKQHDETTKRYTAVKEKLLELQASINKTEAQYGQCITRRESDDIKRKYAIMESEHQDKEAAMLVYKKMYEALVQQMRSLEIAFVRRKDETTQMQKTILELQAGNDKDNLIGKLYYVITLSRWQEATTNRKYDAALTELKNLRAAIYEAQTDIAEKEEDIRKLESSLNDSVGIIAKLKDELASREVTGMSIEKMREVHAKLKEMTESKIDIEIENVKMREENTKLAYEIDEVKAEKMNAKELLTMLEMKTESELSRKIIELSEKLSSQRLAELRSEREAKIAKEKAVYLERVNNQTSLQIKKLEEELSAAQSSMHKKEEEFRARDVERERFFFEQKQQKALNTRHKESANSPKNIENPPGSKDVISDRKWRTALIKPPTKEEGKQDDSEKVKSRIFFELEEKNKMLQKELDEKTRILQQWTQQENMLMRGTADAKDMIEKRKLDVDLLREEDKRQMAEAAYKTVKTLEGIINAQKEQLKRKDDQIQEIREEMVKQRNKDASEISQLQRQLAGETKQALGKIISYGNELSYKMQKPVPASEAALMSIGEVDKAFTQKDLKLRHQADKLEHRDVELRKRDEEVVELRRQNDELLTKLEKMEREHNTEAKKNELKKTKKELKEKIKEIENFKKSILELKKDIAEVTDKKQENEQKANELGAQSNGWVAEKNNLEDRIRKAKKEIQKLTEDAKKAREEIEALKKNEKEMIDKITEVTKINEAKRNECEELKTENNRLIAQVAELKQEIENFKAAAAGDEKAHDRYLVAEIERLKKIVAEKEVQQRAIGAGAVDVEIEFNPDACLYLAKNAISITSLFYIDEIVAKLKQSVNQLLSPYDIFYFYAKNQLDIPESAAKEAFDKLGVRFDESTWDILIKKMKRDPLNPFLEYVDLCYSIKGSTCTRYIDPELFELGKALNELNSSDKEIYMSFPGSESNPENKPIPKSAFCEGLKKLNIINEATQDYLVKRFRTIPDENAKEQEEVINIIQFASIAQAAAGITAVEDLREKAKNRHKELVEMFSNLDENNDKKLNAVEFDKLLSILGALPSKQNQENIMRIFETNLLVHFERFCDIFRIPESERNYFKSLSSNKIQNDIMIACRRAAKKIQLSFGDKLMQIFNEADTEEIGLLPVAECSKILMSTNLNDIKAAEVKLLLKQMDPIGLNYICYYAFTAKIADMAAETLGDGLIRTIANLCRRKNGFNYMQSQFQVFEKGAGGKLPPEKFKLVLQNLKIGLSGDELQGLEARYKTGDHGMLIDSKEFLNDIKFALDHKAVPGPIMMKSQAPTKSTMKTFGGKGEKGDKIITGKKKTPTEEIKKPANQMEEEKGSVFMSSGIMAKQKAIESQLETLKKENNNLQLENLRLQHKVDEMALRKQESVLRASEIRDSATMPAKDFASLKTMSAKKENTPRNMTLISKNAELETKNIALEKQIETDLKPQILKLKQNAEKLKKEIQFQKLENLKLQSQVEKYLSKQMDNVEKNAEIEFLHDAKIKELEKKCDEETNRAKIMENSINKLEQENLELKFDKESFDLKYSRLEKRIKDLQEYNSSAGEGA